MAGDLARLLAPVRGSVTGLRRAVGVKSTVIPATSRTDTKTGRSTTAATGHKKGANDAVGAWGKPAASRLRALL
jgi:hypothetical protein